VLGRSLPFNKLLADHRAAKEESFRRKMSVKLGVGSPAPVTTPDSHHSALATDCKALPSPAVTSPSNSSRDAADVEPPSSPRVPARSPSPPPPTKSSWRSAWKARCSLLRSARLFKILEPSHFAASTDDAPIKRFVTQSFLNPLLPCVTVIQ